MSYTSWFVNAMQMWTGAYTLTVLPLFCAELIAMLPVRATRYSQDVMAASQFSRSSENSISSPLPLRHRTNSSSLKKIFFHSRVVNKVDSCFTSSVSFSQNENRPCNDVNFSANSTSGSWFE